MQLHSLITCNTRTLQKWVCRALAFLGFSCLKISRRDTEPPGGSKKYDGMGAAVHICGVILLGMDKYQTPQRLCWAVLKHEGRTALRFGLASCWIESLSWLPDVILKFSLNISGDIVNSCVGGRVWTLDKIPVCCVTVNNYIGCFL